MTHVTYAVRPHVYRGDSGFHVGSRGRGGYPISIFVTRRDGAELIRDAYTAAERGFITDEERDLYVDAAFDAESAPDPHDAHVANPDLRDPVGCNQCQSEAEAQWEDRFS